MEAAAAAASLSSVFPKSTLHTDWPESMDPGRRLGKLLDIFRWLL